MARSIYFSVLILTCSINSAKAEPISAIIAVVSSIGSAITAAVGAVGTAVFGAGAWAAISGFLASPFGSLIVGIGLSLVSTMFMSKQKKSQNAPSVEAGRVNVRITEPERWICGGKARQGGGVVFGEFDGNGTWWHIIIHSDSILTGLERCYLDDIEITTDEVGNVTNYEFCLDAEFNSLNGSIAGKIPYFLISTSTYTESNPVPPILADFKANFPDWTDDHKLVGTTFTVFRGKSLPPEHRHKLYRWKGPFGIGEPSVSVVGDWSNMYDPRDETQILGNRGTYKPSRNPVIVWAWFRTHRYGRGKAESEINWTRVAEQANICDETVVGIESTQKRYECGISIPESKMRTVAEQEILMSCDGQLVFDDDGKSWMRVGHYHAPTLVLHRNRDIVGMESAEAQNGESETQGVIVRYIDPASKYSVQPSAAWINSLYYVEGQTPKFLQIDALTIQNHNQAMRIAKAIGGRSQPAHKILPTVGLRGLQATQERIVSILYDNTFSGDYEIATNVEVDEIGMFCGFGAVPVDSNRWSLTAGEEKPKPKVAEVSGIINLPLASGVVASFTSNRLEVTFDPPARADFRYRFQFLPTTEDPELGTWAEMSVSMLQNFAYSGPVGYNENYYIRSATLTTAGKSSTWGTPIVINTSPITLTGTPINTIVVNTPYNFTITATGGSEIYTYEDVGGNLPPGITFSGGVVSGTPTSTGVYNDIMLKVSDNVGNFKFFPTFSITVTP